MPRLNLRLFGPPRLELDDQPAELPRRKSLALLVYLAVIAEPHCHEALSVLFWPEHEQRLTAVNEQSHNRGENDDHPG